MILADGVKVRDISASPLNAMCGCRKLNFRRDTLEDIFLKAMGS